MNMWILDNYKKDFVFLILPAFFVIAFSHLFTNQDLVINIFLLLFIFHVVDSGHVYLTFFRTYGNNEERGSSKVYLFTPIIIFLLFFTWLITNSPYIWHFVVYATFYHNIRQFYGITRWYQKKGSQFSVWPGRFIYSLCTLSVIIYHFRSNIPTGMYSQKDIFHNPSESLLRLSLILYSLLFLSWISYEAYAFYKQKNSLGRFFSALTPISAYGAGLIFGTNFLQVLGPIVIAHGVGYAALIAFSLQRTDPQRYTSFKRLMILLCGVAIIFGIIESYTEEFLEPLLQGLTVNSPNHWLFSIVAALYLTPLFCHYFFDGFLWKSTHREAHLIYN